MVKYKDLNVEKSGDAEKGRMGNGNCRVQGWGLGPLRWLVLIGTPFVINSSKGALQSVQ